MWFDSMHTMNYDVCRTGWIGDYVDPFSFLGIFITGGGNNDCGFANPAVRRPDCPLAHGRPTAPERKELLQQAETILLDEAPVAPIFYYARVYLKQTSVQGLVSPTCWIATCPSLFRLMKTRRTGFKKVAAGRHASSRAAKGRHGRIQRGHTIRESRD